MTARLTTGRRILMGGFFAAWIVAWAFFAVGHFHAEKCAADSGNADNCGICLFSQAPIESSTTEVALELGTTIVGLFTAAPDFFFAPVDFLSPSGRAPPVSFLL